MTLDRAGENYTERQDSASRGESLTRHVAEFVVDTQYSNIPADVIEIGKNSILDGIGLAIAGSVATTGKCIEAYLRKLNIGAGPATILGTNMRLAPRFAAFANAIAIHAEDYDDTQLAVAKDRVYGLLTHPTAPALPAALADAESLGLDGRAFMLAYHLGIEVECKIAEAINPRHYQGGFHSTGTCGPFAAAVACAKSRQFDVGRVERSLSLSASQSAGLRANFGTMTKPFHAGRASESGVMAADLVEIGWTAADRILEGERGFFLATAGGYNRDAIDGKLGKPWTFAAPGISIKPHPSGSLTHPGMTEMLRLMREHGISARMVERIEVGTNRNMPDALIYQDPQTALEAKFSMEYCLAILLLDGKAGLAEFTDQSLKRSDVRDLIGRIHVHIHPEAESAGYDKMTTILDLYLRDGRKISGRAEFAKGSPANPMHYQDVAEKFRTCCDYARWPRQSTERLIELVQQLETLKDIRQLTALCTVETQQR